MTCNGFKTRLLDFDNFRSGVLLEWAQQLSTAKPKNDNLHMSQLLCKPGMAPATPTQGSQLIYRKDLSKQPSVFSHPNRHVPAKRKRKFLK